MNEFEEPDLAVRLRDMAGGNECHLAYRAAEVITVLREIRGHNDLLIQDLASLVRRMSYAIAHSDNKNPLIRESIELLKKHNLGGSPKLSPLSKQKCPHHDSRISLACFYPIYYLS